MHDDGSLLVVADASLPRMDIDNPCCCLVDGGGSVVVVAVVPVVVVVRMVMMIRSDDGAPSLVFLDESLVGAIDETWFRLKT
jgi:hypothetical protein